MNSYSKSDNPYFTKKFFWRLNAILVLMLFIAISLVCFFAPLLEAFDTWMEKDIRHSIYVFVVSTSFLAVGLIWIRFRKK